MSTTPMPQERLDAIRERERAATEGPWAPWLDQDGQPHMQGRLMVGVAAGVIPDGDTWVEGPDVNNPVAETYIPEDRAFIAHAREDVPALLAEVERLQHFESIVSWQWGDTTDGRTREDIVERAARESWCLDMQGNHALWDKLPDEKREPWRNAAYIALEAALNPREGS